jgi:hypothetical protein
MKLALSILLVSLFTGTVLAQQSSEPANTEEVQQLFEVMHARQNATAYIDTMKQQMPKIMHDLMDQRLPNATPEEREKMNHFINDSLTKTFDSMPMEELNKIIMTVYQRHLTHRDVQDMLAFYASPTGQKVISEMPKIMGEYMQAATPIMEKWANQRMAEVTKSAIEYANTLKQEKQGSRKPEKKS